MSPLQARNQWTAVRGYRRGRGGSPAATPESDLGAGHGSADGGIGGQSTSDRNDRGRAIAGPRGLVRPEARPEGREVLRMGGIHMKIVSHSEQAREEWRAGVETRMLASAGNGAGQFCIFEQWIAPSMGAPTHSHAVEEVLTVVSGEAEIWVHDEAAILTSGQTSSFRPGASTASEMPDRARFICMPCSHRRFSRPPTMTAGSSDAGFRQQKIRTDAAFPTERPPVSAAAAHPAFCRSRGLIHGRRSPPHS
ncbi:cupin domain-containing protein [Mycobacterium sp. KBS0706]|uniref:cupin domain-containing protein n=1 Tax=Mycobacterium sp. KBS0706 TaxID=2578109 RepID=UPI0035A09917